jgi:hypothetical protein
MAPSYMNANAKTDHLRDQHPFAQLERTEFAAVVVFEQISQTVVWGSWVAREC